MDRTAFEYLYLHANALAELGFIRASVALAAAAQAEPTPEALAERAAFAEAIMNPDPEKFDWSAFDGMEIPSSLEEASGTSVPVVDLGPTFEQAMELVGATYDFETFPELEPYVVHLYAAGPLLRERISAHHAAAEPSVDAALMVIDPSPAPLQGPLTPAQLLVWLDRYEGQDEAVQLVVQRVRSFDPSPLGGVLSPQ
ncbi:hypothetical protein [Roseateles sp.]|uniref:hypothetical protein n=1 Tax=Roseateles sp. TaxID=1971397 RepID=UPI003264FE6C